MDLLQLIVESEPGDLTIGYVPKFGSQYSIRSTSPYNQDIPTIYSFYRLLMTVERTPRNLYNTKCLSHVLILKYRPSPCTYYSTVKPFWNK